MTPILFWLQASFSPAKLSLYRRDSLELRSQIASLRNLRFVNCCRPGFLNSSSLSVVGCRGQHHPSPRAAFNHCITAVGRHSVGKCTQAFDSEWNLSPIVRRLHLPVNLQLKQVAGLRIEP